MSLLISKNYPSQVNTLLTEDILSSPENKAVLPASHVILREQKPEHPSPQCVPLIVNTHRVISTCE